MSEKERERERERERGRQEINVLTTHSTHFSGVGRCQKVGGGGTQTRNLCTFGKEPI